MVETAVATAPVTPPASADRAVMLRIEKLERNVKKLKRQLRSVSKDRFEEIELSPEVQKLIDDRLKEADENPGNTVPWETVRAELQQRYGIK